MSAPEWGCERRTLAISTMASRAGGSEYRHAAIEITIDRFEPREALTFHLRADWNSAGYEREIRNDVSHVPPGWSERFAIHASLEAVVYSILDEIDLSAPGSILRESRVAPDPGHGVSTKTVVEMAAGASESVADIVRQAVPRREKNRAATESRGPISTVAELDVRRDAKWDASGRGRLLGGNCRLRMGERALGRDEQDQARDNTSNE